MRIKRLRGENLRFQVKSRSGSQWYLVDLSERGGHGICQCKMFGIRAASNFRKYQRHIPYRVDNDGKCSNAESTTECAHIYAARKLNETVVRRLYASQARGEEQWFRSLWRAFR